MHSIHSDKDGNENKRVHEWVDVCNNSELERAELSRCIDSRHYSEEGGNIRALLDETQAATLVLQ